MALDPDQARHGLTVLTRLAQRSPAGERQLAQLLAADPEGLAVPAAAVAIETGEPIAGLLTALLRERPPSTETLLALRSANPAGELGLLVHELLAERIRDGDAVDPYLAVDILAGLANRLLAAGQDADAHRIAADAIARGRGLPDKFDELGLLVALDVLSRAQTTVGRHEAAGETITEAVRAAERRFGGLAEPYLGHLLLTQAEQLRRAGHAAAALDAYTRAARVWREIRQVPDLNHELVLGRLGSAGAAEHGLLRIGPDGAPEPVPSIHIAIGGPSASLYEGPVYGGYRLNAVMAQDGEIYVSPRAWSPTRAMRSLATALRERGRTLLLLGEPGRALADLREAAGLLADESAGVHAADTEFVLAHCLQWSGLAAEAATAAERACALLAGLHERSDGPEQALAEHACLAVAAGLGRATPGWPRYFEQLVALGHTRAPADGGVLLGAVVGRLHDLALILKGEDALEPAITLLRLVVDAAADPAQRAVSLVSLANGWLRAGDADAGAAAASRAADEAADPRVAAMAQHALARCLAAAGRAGEALAARERAVASALAADPVAHADFVVPLLSAYVDATTPGDGRARLPADVRAAVADLLAAVPELTDGSAGALAELGFALLSQAARERDVARARAEYDAFLAFAHARDTRQARFARAIVAWNLAMCFVDGADWPSAHRVLDDVGALVAAYPEEDVFRVEHAKTASELLAAYWNAGHHEQARAVVRACSASLRSPQYLRARLRDIGDPPANFLAVLDQIEHDSRP